MFHLDLSCLHIDYNLIGQLPKAVDDVTACYNGYQVQLSLNAKILDNLKIVAVVSASPYSSHGDFYILDKRQLKCYGVTRFQVKYEAIAGGLVLASREHNYRQTHTT